MYFDDKELLISDTSKFPGSHGDSCVETSTYIVISKNFADNANRLGQFFVGDENVRHPKLNGYVDEKGDSWGTDDFSVDQWLALWVACTLYVPGGASVMFRQLCRSYARVGDGSFINLITFATIRRAWGNASWFWDLAFLLHANFSLLPFRFSDSKWRDKKWPFESSSNHSADYKNWFLAGPLYAHRTNSFTWIMREAMLVIDRAKMKEKIRSYYEKEINSAFMVSLWENAIDEVYDSRFGTD